jgi:tetratricopeptide (TPR) repeat protein
VRSPPPAAADLTAPLPPVGIAAQRLAQVYKKLGDADNAVVYFHKHLTRRQEEGNLFGPDVVEALRYVAVFLRDRNRLDQALRFAERLQRVVGPGDREADALLREIQAMRGAHA